MLAAPVVMMAAAPELAKKVPVPETPMVVKPAARPAPIMGARRPADRPMTRPPPTVARPIITYRRFSASLRRDSMCSSSFQFSFSAFCCISSASVTFFSNLQMSIQGISKAWATRSRSTLDLAS